LSLFLAGSTFARDAELSKLDLHSNPSNVPNSPTEPNSPTDTNTTDLLTDLLLVDENPAAQPVAYTFKSTRVINTHSIENVAAGVLDFRIMHRFGAINGGWYELWGLDQASMRMSLDYGITPRLMVGGGRSNVGKSYDGFIKYKIIRQSGGGRGAKPFSLSYVAGTILSAQRWADPERKNYFSSRLSYYHQLLLAKKNLGGSQPSSHPHLAPPQFGLGTRNTQYPDGDRNGGTHQSRTPRIAQRGLHLGAQSRGLGNAKQPIAGGGYRNRGPCFSTAFDQQPRPERGPIHRRYPWELERRVRLLWL